MIDALIKAGVCRITCGEHTSTAFLVSDSLIITARHCVFDAIENGMPITVSFPQKNIEDTTQATVVADDKEFDICLLATQGRIEGQTLPVSTDTPREGAAWQSFGFPASKTQIGHRVSGVISQALAAPRVGIDLDLTIEPSHALASYRGLSGAPVVSAGKCVAVLRLRVDGTLGAISIKTINDFLNRNDIKPEIGTNEPESAVNQTELAERIEFQNEFEEKLAQAGGLFMFLEGAHGIGKSTFCNEFDVSRPDLLPIGAYSFSVNTRGAGAIVRAQPEVFFDWLSTTVSTLLTGQPPRKQDRDFPTAVEETARLLAALSDHCKTRDQTGIIFIDGINEAFAADAASSMKLLGLLPINLPKNVSIVLTAPNFDSVKTQLSQYVKVGNVLELPRLSEMSCMDFCMRELKAKQRNVSLIAQICEKAKGHPLYLRYLIEFVNNTDQTSLDDFPVFSESIEEYYDALWSRLLADADAINLLAIIARLRWAVGRKDLLGMLSVSEQRTFISTAPKIRHLLSNPEAPEIYHSSFSEFIRSKTSDIDEFIHQRIAEYCLASSQLDYCQLNIVHHQLLSGEEGRWIAISTCNQEWVDHCVAHGVEPDVLLEDINAALSTAIDRAAAVEALRLLLLEQRVTFRYNVLFTQSAYLIANALITINRPHEAVKHAIRFGHLLVAPDEALKIVLSLAHHGYESEAFDILKPLYHQVIEWCQSDAGHTTRDFVELHRLLVRVNIYGQLVDGHDRSHIYARIINNVHTTLSEHFDSSNKPVLEHCIAHIQSVVTATAIYFFDRYVSLNELKAITKEKKLPDSILLSLIYAAIEYASLTEEFGVPSQRESLEPLFADILELLRENSQPLDPLIRAQILDIAIELGAPVELATVLASQLDEASPSQLEITQENEVDVAFDNIRESLTHWRMVGFLDVESECPLIGAFTETGWIKALGQLLCAVAWCEGRARRETSDGSKLPERIAYRVLTSQILPALKITLAQRVNWKQSYLIPETVFPLIWERVAVMLRDCFQDKRHLFLQQLTPQIPSQLGLYSEGFRQCLDVIALKIAGLEPNATIHESFLEFLREWRDYVCTGVENRHELVPELLKLIPLFSRIGAKEEASKLYEVMLSVSMGPSWYKEDQLGLMNTVLRQMPTNEQVMGALPLIGGYLERASGEMTFQRFVRYEKAALLGELFRRGYYAQGTRYFQRQSCGSLAELQQDIETGKTDRVSSTVGSRFPGGALDEQYAILQVIKNLDSDWRLLWSLLEIFQCGDRRHIRDFAAGYATIVNQMTHTDAVEESVRRLRLILETEISSSDRGEFIEIFSNKLDDNQTMFDDLVNDYGQHTVSNLDHKLTPKQSQASIDESRQRPVDDSFVVPGTFGRQSAMYSADEALKLAEQNFKLGNYDAARGGAVRALRVMQDGGWSIWGDLSGTANRAEELIGFQEENANKIIQWYRPLIEEEMYQPRWRIADHLIGKIGSRLSCEDRRAVMDHVIEHIRLMVGDSAQEVDRYRFLEDNSTTSDHIELFKFIVWLADHPNWLRRSKAADIFLWLVESDDLYFEEGARIAFSNAVGYGADIACGALDVMSSRQSAALWTRLTDKVDLQSVAHTCRHVGRLAVLYRIAERATSAGVDESKTVAATLKGMFRFGKIELDVPEEHVLAPAWATCLSSELRKLRKLGLLTKELLNSVETELSEVCKPLSIQDAWELEKAVSTSFREGIDHPLGRWAGKIRFALGRALYFYASQKNFIDIEAILRPFNPYAPTRILATKAKSRGHEMIKLINAGDYKNVIGTAESYYLHYFETLIYEDDTGIENKPSFIEVLAFVVSDREKTQTFNAAMASSFASREYLDFSANDGIGPTCVHLKPQFAFFGSFTASFVTPSFARLIGSSGYDFKRVNWQDGRSYKVGDLGRPEFEGCHLTVKRSAVRLPEGMRMVWLIKLNNEVMTAVDANGILVR